MVQCGKLDMYYRLKVAKYRDDLELRQAIMDRYAIQEVKYEACTISYKGIRSKRSVSALSELGVGNYCLFKIVTSVIRGIWLNWKWFNRINTVVH